MIDTPQIVELTAPFMWEFMIGLLVTAIVSLVAHSIWSHYKLIEMRDSIVSTKAEVIKIRQDTFQLREMHEKFNADGTPLWYFPVSLGRTMEEMKKCLEEISNYQRKILVALEKTRP